MYISIAKLELGVKIYVPKLELGNERKPLKSMGGAGCSPRIGLQNSGKNLVCASIIPPKKPRKAPGACR
jgi:hypothetical protein